MLWCGVRYCVAQGDGNSGSPRAAGKKGAPAAPTRVEVGTLLPREAFGEDTIMGVQSVMKQQGHHERKHSHGAQSQSPRSCIATGSLVSNTNVSVFMIPKVRALPPLVTLRPAQR